jgi:MtrB/PioB family decaheme-associated outer membrane protein
MKRTHISVVLRVLALVLLAAMPLWAAADPASDAGGSPPATTSTGFTWHATTTVGAETISGEKSSSKFQEYRDVPNGLFLESLNVVGEHPKGAHLELGITRLGQHDEQASITGGEWGRYSLFLTYDKLPHRISNTSALIFQRTQENVFTLPTAVKAEFGAIDTSTDAGKTAFSDLVNGLARSFPLGMQRSTWAVGGTADQGGPTSYYFRFSDEHRDGTKPIGATLNGFSNMVMVELPEPVRYHTRDIDAGVEYHDKRGGLQLGYQGQFFSNEYTSLVWDSPIATTDTAASSSRGQLALPPDNSSHTLSLSGVYNFCPRTRVVGDISAGTWLQNDTLISSTINSALAVGPLPETSSNLQTDTLLGDLQFTSSLTDKLSFKAGWRRYRMHDRRPSLDFQQVITDQTLGDIENIADQPNDFVTNNVKVDFDYAVRPDLNLTLGWEREAWHRNKRDVAHTAENTLEVGANYLSGRLLTIRAFYSAADKNIGPYVGDESQLPDLRKYDEAARTRTQAGVVMQLTPSDAFQADLSWDIGRDDYEQSLFGLIGENTSDISLDLGYSLSPDTSAYLGASRERDHSHLRSRYRPFDDATGEPVDDSLNDWDSLQRDHDMTYWAGVSHTFVPGKWDADLSLSLTNGHGAVDVVPVPGGVAQGDGTNWPDTKFTFLALEAAASHQLKGNLKLRFSYRFEDYREVDFAQDLMQPYMGFIDSSTATAVFLGARAPSYRAHIVAVSLQTKF